MQDTPVIDALIRKLAMLGDVQEDDRAALRALPTRIERVPARHQIIVEGHRVHECCILIDGFAHRYKLSRDGGRQIVSFHIKGDLLDVQHLTLETADHSVESLTDAQLLFVPVGELQRLLQARPRIWQAVWRDALIDASIFREWVLNVGRRDAQTRIAHMLCEFVARCAKVGIANPGGFELQMTQNDIADATGLTSVHVNRMLRSLREAGVLEQKGRSIRILDWQQMQRVADFDPAYLHQAA